MADNPFLRRRKLTEPAPDEYSPEEQDNLLRSVGSSAVSGMGYVGGMLDKFTGSRALRGVLGGKPRELLSLIPGSDTFGITDQKDIVGGKDLLQWNDPNSWADDIAGFGVEVALDPTWLVGGGAVGAGGKVLKAAGLGGKAGRTAVNVARSARIADEVAKGTKLSKAIRLAREATPDGSIGELTGRLTTTARQRLEDAVRLPEGYAHGAASRVDMPGVSGLPDQLASFSRAAKAKGLDPSKILDEPIQRSILKIGLPGMEPWFEIGKGSQALKAAGAIDAGGKLISAPLRGYRSHANNEAEKTFRASLRANAPSSIADDQVDTWVDMYRAYAEGYHGETLGEFLNKRKIKHADASFVPPADTLWQNHLEVKVGDDTFYIPGDPSGKDATSSLKAVHDRKVPQSLIDRFDRSTVTKEFGTIEGRPAEIRTHKKAPPGGDHLKVKGEPDGSFMLIMNNPSDELKMTGGIRFELTKSYNKSVPEFVRDLVQYAEAKGIKGFKGSSAETSDALTQMRQRSNAFLKLEHDLDMGRLPDEAIAEPREFESDGIFSRITRIANGVLEKRAEEAVTNRPMALSFADKDEALRHVDMLEERGEPLGNAISNAIEGKNVVKVHKKTVGDYDEYNVVLYNERGDVVSSRNIGTQMRSAPSQGKIKAKIEEMLDEVAQGNSGDRKVLFQGGSQANAKAAVSFMPDQSIVLQTFKAADFSSHVHEFSHVASKFLNDGDRAIVNKFLGKADNAAWDTWSKADHEKFAEGFEKWWTSGKAPSGALENIWKKIQQWMTSVYNTVAKRGQLADVSPEVQEVYGRLVQGRPGHLKGYTLPGSPRALKVAAGIDTAGKALRFNPATRLLAQNMDAKSMGMETEFGQRMGREVTEALPGARQEALRDSKISMLEMGERGKLDPQSGREIQRQAEGFDPVAPDNKSFIDRERQGIEDWFQRAQHVGAAGNRHADPLMPQYWPRERASKAISKAFKKAVDAAVLSKTASTDKSRLDFLTKIKGGTDNLEIELLRNPTLVGSAKLPTLKAHVAYLESLKPTLLPLHSDKEIKRLARFLRRLPDDVPTTGFYKNPIEAAQSYKVRLAEKTAKAETTLKYLNEQLSKTPSADGVPLNNVLKSLKLRRGGMSPTQLKGLVTEISNGTKTTGDLVRELERLENGAYARISEMRGYHNPTPAMIHQLKAGTITPEKAVKQVAKWHGNLKKLTVSRQAADEFARVNEFFKGPKAAGKIMKILDSYLNLFKAGVLTWPSRYVRDLASGQMQNVMIGEFSPKMLRISRDVLSGKTIAIHEALQFPIVKEMLAKEGLPETVENANRMLRAHLGSMELVGERVADISQIGGPKAVQGVHALHQQIPGVRPLNLKEAGKQLRRSNPNWKPKNWGIRGVGNAQETTMPVLEAGNVTGTYIDALNRLPAYLNQLKRGVDPAAAKAKVMSAHVDYSNRALSAVERQWLTRLAPFYRYSKGMANHTFDELLKNPHGRLAQTVRGSSRMQRNSGDDSIVPEHIGRTLSIPVPKNAVTDALGLSAPEGNTRYLTGLGLMHEDPLSLFQPGSNAYHTARSTGQSLIGRMNPLLKGPMELAFGKQAFSGRQLEDLDPNVGRIAANIAGKDQPFETPILMEQAIANSPASRAVSSLRTLTDTRPNATNKAIVNLLSGVRLSDVDNEKTMNLARRKLLEELLRGSPGVHRFEHLFAPDDTKLSERERQLMALYRQLSRKSAKEARERKKEEAKK